MDATRAIATAAAATADMPAKTASTRKPTLVWSRYNDVVVFNYVKLTAVHITNDETSAVQQFADVAKFRHERQAVRDTYNDREF